MYLVVIEAQNDHWMNGKSLLFLENLGRKISLIILSRVII